MAAEETPLQVKLDQLAEVIAKLGVSISLLLLIVLLIKYLVKESVDGQWPEPYVIGDNIIQVHSDMLDFTNFGFEFVVDCDPGHYYNCSGGSGRLASCCYVGVGLCYQQNVERQQFGQSVGGL